MHRLVVMVVTVVLTLPALRRPSPGLRRPGRLYALLARARLERLLQMGLRASHDPPGGAPLHARLRRTRQRDGDIYASQHTCRRGRVTVRFYGMVLNRVRRIAADV